MNSMQLKDRIRNISKNNNIDFNTLLRLYMYDRFIERLGNSKYKHNFILKGGFYLSTLFGVENRTTMDIDTAFNKAVFSKGNIEKMIKEIVAVEIDDNAKISYLGITPIRDEDEYGGFRVSLQVEIENVKEKFHIDVATGDTITPKEILYKYKPALGDKYINLWAYNIETVLAEKIETILSRLELNGRMRDYYDIYLIHTRDWNNINVNHFRKALENTFKKREYKNDINEALNIIKDSKELKKRWLNYRRKFSYAKEIEFDDIVKSIIIIMENVNKVML